MASFSHAYFQSHCHFYPDELSEIMSIMAQENYGGGATFSSAISPCGSTLIDDDILPMSFANIGQFDAMPPDSGLTRHRPPPPIMTMFHKQPQLDIFGMVDPQTKQDCKMESRGYGVIASNVHNNIGGGSQLFNNYEFGENYSGQRCKGTVASECNVKVGRYTEEERKDRILRYLKKRNQRNFNKTIKYACRKRLADQRLRIRGRFAKNDELFKEKPTPIIEDDNCHLENGSYYDMAQIRMDKDEEWLQEVVTSLLRVPSVVG